MKQHDEEHIKAVIGSGNVFADLGLEYADELLVKADLAHAINAEIRSCGYAQAEVVKRTGLTQSDVSKIGRMKTDGFSQERLQKVLIQFGVDVEIRLHHREDGQIGTLRVLETA